MHEPHDSRNRSTDDIISSLDSSRRLYDSFEKADRAIELGKKALKIFGILVLIALLIWQSSNIIDFASFIYQRVSTEEKTLIALCSLSYLAGSLMTLIIKRKE